MSLARDLKYNTDLKNSTGPINRGIIEIFELLSYLLIAFILVYFVNVRINRFLFLIFLPLIWRSKRDYLWLAFFFILMEQPGGLFSGGLRADPYRLPIYSFAPGFSIAFHELIILVFFVKTLAKGNFKKNYQRTVFNKELKMLLILYVVLIIISPLLGLSVNSLTNIVKLSIALTLLYSLFRLINNDEQIVRFLGILFPFVFVALALQIYGMINGQQLVALIKPGTSVVQGVYDLADNKTNWFRPIEMGHAMLISFTGSLWLIAKGNSVFNKQYLLLVNLISFLVIFLTGTRTWVISFGAGYLLFFLFMGVKAPKFLFRSFIAIVLFVIIINAIPVINNQIRNSWSRIITVEEVIEGDITGGGTISRYDVRAPKVMEGFMSSSIILGAGFSDHFYRYADGHVGYHNILLNTGIAGLLLILYAIFKIIRYPFIIARKVKFFNDQLLKISVIPLVILMFINNGTQMIGFTPDGINRFILMFFALIMIDLTVKQSIQERYPMQYYYGE
ncbi:MAG: hypothetical protein JXB49_03870 [Bacteroidales bacterium]|nr:hypothetical protein [Bacteroidales bacterium]